MPLNKLIAGFEYDKVPEEFDIRSQDHLWAKLEAVAAERQGCEYAQMIHDVSWVLTQLRDEDRQRLFAIRREIADSLQSEYGPLVLDWCGDIGWNLEGFILPLGKAALGGRALGLEGFMLESLVAQQHRAPSLEFAAVFAVLFVRKQMDSNTEPMSIESGQTGTRVRIGRVRQCQNCNSTGLLKDRVEDLIEQARREAVNATARVSARAPVTAVSSGLVKKITAFVGEKVDCSACDGRGVDTKRVEGLLQDPRVLLNPNFRKVFSPTAEGIQVDLAAALRYFGDEVKCQRCNGSRRDMSKCRAVAGTRLPGSQDKKVRDLLGELRLNEGWNTQDLVGIYGDGILCARCALYLEVPQEARNGWICPVVDGQGNRHTWKRLRLPG